MSGILIKDAPPKGTVPFATLAAEYAQAIANRQAMQLALREQMLSVAAGLIGALREATQAESDCQAALLAEVEAHPELFGAPRRSRQVQGIRYGWRAGKDRIEIPDEGKTIALIRKHLPEAQQVLLIQVKESVYKPSVKDLTAADLRRLGIRQVRSPDAPFVTPANDEADRLVLALLDETVAQEGAA
jgi:hypothetical protein